MTGVEIALAASAALSAVSAVSSGMQAKNAAKVQATIAEQNATLAQQQAAAQEAKYRQQTTKLLGRQRALFANSGVNLEGSPLLTQQDTAAQSELEALTMRHSGDIEASAQRNRAMMARLEGSTALSNGILRAGSTLLSAYGSYGLRNPGKPPAVAASAEWPEAIDT